MSMFDDLYIVGSAWTPVTGEGGLQLDELVFETCSRALRDAGVLRHQIGLSVTSSLDLYDARSISSALTAPAAAGYLTDELRVEGDASAALLVAAAGLASGATEYALVVALHVPEVGTVDERDIRRLDEHISSYTFDSHTDRPVGMTATVTLGLHAARRVDDGSLTVDHLAERAARDLTRGAGQPGRRAVADAVVVRAAAPVATPLTELMLPAASAGVAAMVLSVGVSGRRCPNPRARISGWGKATAPATSNPKWLEDPCGAAALAAERAYARAGLTDPAAQVDVVEMTDLSPALSDELITALQLGGVSDDSVNRSGGVRSSHPGVANGLLRVIEATNGLADSSPGTGAVVHSTDNLCGVIASTATVLVLEAV